MLRATTLLIVTILLATPGLSLACELWCLSPPAEEHHLASGPDRERCTSTSPQLRAAGVCGTPALAPFLSEPRQTTSRAVTSTPVPAAVATIAEQGGERANWWQRSQVQSPRPAVSLSILRI